MLHPDVVTLAPKPDYKPIHPSIHQPGKLMNWHMHSIHVILGEVATEILVHNTEPFLLVLPNPPTSIQQYAYPPLD